MNLQSGFQEVGVNVEFEANETIPDLEQLLIDSQPEQVFEPGTVTAYNNWTPALAAFVVETVTGQPFYDYLQEHIFQPLEMHHTAVAADWSDNAYVKDNRQKSKSYYYTTKNRDSLGASILHVGLYPAGASAGTFGDFLTFATEFSKEHPRFFKEADTYTKMKEASAVYADGLPRVHHGLLSIDDATHIIGHSGNTQGFTSAFWFDPNTNVGYAVMTNEPAETAYNYGLAQLLFGTSKPTPVESIDISGLYTSQRTIHQGASRFTKYLAGILPISKSDKEGIFNISLAGMTVTSQGNQRYHFDKGNGFAYQVALQEQNGTLETLTTDYQRVGTPELVLAYGLLISVVVVLIAMFIRFIVRLVKRIKGTKNGMTPGFMSHIAAALVSVTFLYFWLFASRYTRLQMAIVAVIFCSLQHCDCL